MKGTCPANKFTRYINSHGTSDRSQYVADQKESVRVVLRLSRI